MNRQIHQSFSRQSFVLYGMVISQAPVEYHCLLHETQHEARGRVLIAMISYKCLWYNWLKYPTAFDYKQQEKKPATFFELILLLSMYVKSILMFLRVIT